MIKSINDFAIYRSIITAGHCICTERIEDKELYLECLPNSDKKNPSNQITFGRVIFYVVGERIVDERLRSQNEWRDVLYDLPKAQKAFAYATNNHVLKTIDIGILIVDIPDWKISNPIEDRTSVCPIELPDKGYVKFTDKIYFKYSLKEKQMLRY